MSLGGSGRWQALYVSAMSEVDESERRKKAEAADAEMRRRAKELRRRRDTESVLEVQAITAALEKLASLRAPESTPQLSGMSDDKGSGGMHPPR